MRPHRLAFRRRYQRLAGQRVEAQLACRILNTMTRLGMPDSYRVGFVNSSEIHGETRDPSVRKPPVFGRLVSGRDVQAGKNQLKLTVPRPRSQTGSASLCYTPAPVLAILVAYLDPNGLV